LRILEHAKAALEALDVDAIVALYADDAELRDASTGESFRGSERIRRMFLELFSAPGAEFAHVSVREGPAWGVIEWTWSSKTKGSDKPLRIRGVSVLELAENKVVRETFYYDPRSSSR
ncbi:MAG TPA: nuclear transport factor 2 family protein, partial [Candidatus Thermoplasmatota archaeon]|nr:nuclear transport factor 2 family protein [Candidatus Thermoplasmatota archaeon]